MPTTELRIVLEDDGKVSISGPITNKLLCYGLLEAARDAIKQFNDRPVAQIAQSPIVLPKLGIVANRNGG